jgi:hypothetical protein
MARFKPIRQLIELKKIRIITENQDSRDGDEKVVEVALSGGQFSFQHNQHSSVVIENGSFHGVE